MTDEATPAEEEAEDLAAQANPSVRRPQLRESVYDPVDEYEEYPDSEARVGNHVIDIANPRHQRARLRHSADYIEDTETLFPGYVAPDYSTPAS